MARELIEDPGHDRPIMCASPAPTALAVTGSVVDRSEPGGPTARVTSDTTLLREATTDSLAGLGTGAPTPAAPPPRTTTRCGTC